MGLRLTVCSSKDWPPVSTVTVQETFDRGCLRRSAVASLMRLHCPLEAAQGRGLPNMLSRIPTAVKVSGTPTHATQTPGAPFRPCGQTRGLGQAHTSCDKMRQ